MRMSLVASLLASAAAAGCAKFSTDLPPDTTAPHVELTAPQDGSTVGGGVAIDVSASDNYSVEVVRILIDGTLRATFYTLPYHLLWSTIAIPNNSVHTIVAEAVDPSSNLGRAQVSVTVINGQQ